MSLLIEKLHRQSEYLDSLQEKPAFENDAPSPPATEGICQCAQWKTFPTLPEKCPTCGTRSLCPDCAGGCRWCWWLIITGRVPAVEEVGHYRNEFPF